jgi:DNA-nicking Smr family endonuclease
MRRPRHLSPEERALWDHVARTAVPLHPDRAEAPQAAPGPAVPEVKPAPPPQPIAPFRVGQAASHSGTANLVGGLLQDMGRAAPVRMDARTHERLVRGKLRPEGRIDLHGLTLDQAHPRLTSFILSSAAAGKRLVLVITGKGKPRDEAPPMPVRDGILRHQVPHWLALPPLSAVILQIAPAHISHGGTGALYVYLRRHRT